MNEQERILLLHQKWTGTISPEDRIRLEGYLSTDEAFRKEAEQMESAWNLSDKPKDPPVLLLDTDKAWERFKVRMDEQPVHKARVIKMSAPLRAAAAVAVLLVISLFWIFRPTGTLKISTDRNEVMASYELPDGSVVWLNHNSSLRFPESFDGATERKVYLSGEAFFDVARDITKPFIIETRRSQIEVLGTSFNVNAYSRNSTEEVYVASGKVAFQPLEEPGGELLKARDHAVLKKSTLQISLKPDQDDAPLAWVDEALNFRSTPLRVILDALENHHKVHFKRDKIKKILDCKFTLYFEGESLDNVLGILKKATNVKIAPAGAREFVLTGGTCDK